MPRTGILLILVGPSGAGKNTLMKRVLPRIENLHQLPTVTTRGVRTGEVEGIDHFFVTKEEFQRKIVARELVEYTPVHQGDLYGTPRQYIEDALAAGGDLIADIEFLGAGLVFQAFPENTVLIFITPSSLDILAERISERDNASRQSLADRLARVPFEMTFAPHCHYLVINDVLEPAVEHLRQIVISERARRRDEPATDAVFLLRPPCQHTNVTALVRCGESLLVRGEDRTPEFPAFPLSNRQQPPHVCLTEGLKALSDQFTLDLVLDARFDFPAPHYATAAAIPNDAFAFYTYRCTAHEPVTIAGWRWASVHQLKLPRALRTIVQADHIAHQSAWPPPSEP